MKSDKLIMWQICQRRWHVPLIWRQSDTMKVVSVLYT
jgi:hypothetical protein